MKKQLLRILILSSCFFEKATAQNLVPNGNFEINSGCPTGTAQFSLAIPWTNPTTGSPDYFNACANSATGASVPINSAGYQSSKAGIAYAGFYTFNFFFSDTREYIQVELTDSLKENKLYCVHFYVSLANTMNYSTNTIGAYFSKNAISSSNYYVLPYTPQVVNSSGNLLTDTLDWALISGSFIATGGEKYMTIGNFNTDATSDTMFANNIFLGVKASYYYIDSITVIECDTTTPGKISSITIPNIFTPNNDGSNDVFSITSKNIKTLNCKIYNRWGILVGELKTPNDVWDGRTTTGLPCTDGVYYYVLNAEGEDGKEYNKKDFLHLIR